MKSAISSITLLACVAAANAQTLPPEPVDLDIVKIESNSSGGGTFTINVDVGIARNSAFTDTTGTLHLYVNGNQVGTETFSIIGNLVPCIQQVDHPTCQASCVPFNATCMRTQWGIFDYCDCYIKIRIPFLSISASPDDLLTAYVDPNDVINEVFEDNNDHSIAVSASQAIPAASNVGWGLLAALILVGGALAIRGRRATMSR